MGFKFGLESVLGYRKRLEELAQKDFAEAQHKVTICLERIEKMYQLMDQVRLDIQTAQQAGDSRNIEQVRQMEQFLSGHKLRIEQARQEARELLQIAEQRQDTLVAAAKDKKTLVKLKEKKQAEYREWLNRVETKNLDDLTMARQGRVKR